MGLPHYRDARMQHRQCTQSALFGVTTVVAPRECQHPLTKCSLHPQCKNSGKTKASATRQERLGWSTRIRLCTTMPPIPIPRLTFPFCGQPPTRYSNSNVRLEIMNLWTGFTSWRTEFINSRAQALVTQSSARVLRLHHDR